MENVLVSIVVPIYKTEKYLRRCIDSILKQTYENLEVILVDDGSPDECPQICDEFARIDSRVVVVHKVNQGLGLARNTGIETATGKYICFFDSDDFIEKSAIEELVDIAEKNKAQIVSFGFKQLDSELACKRIVRANETILFLGKERVCNDYIPEMICSRKSDTEIIGLWMSMWSSMFSLDYIKSIGWRCVSERDIISEDVYSLLSFYKEVDRAVVFDKVFYNYCDNNDSLSRVFRTDRIDKINDFYDKTLELCHLLSYGEKITDRISYIYIEFMLSAFKQLCRADVSNRYKVYRMTVDDNKFQLALRQVDLSGMTNAKKFFFISLKKHYYLLGYFVLFLRVKIKKS